MEENPDPQAGQAQRPKLFKDLGEQRDGLLLLGGALYVLGYAIWLFNAWQQNLGMLPAIDSQYLIAGFIPGLILFAVYWGIRLSWRYTARLTPPELLDWNAPVSGWRKWLRMGIILFVNLMLVIVPLLDVAGAFDERFKQYETPVFVASGVVTFLFFFFSILFTTPQEGQGLFVTFKRVFGTFFMVMTIVVLGFLGLYYFTSLYARMPQALGGVRPRCAVLDVSKDDVSQETFNALSPKPTPTPAANPAQGPAPGPAHAAEAAPSKTILRTAPLDVLYSSSDHMLVRVNAGAEGGKPEVYEIKKDVVRAVKWCD